VWGEFATTNGGALWFPTMTGATSIGAIYGRAVAYSRKTPGLRYFGIGVLKDRDPFQGYLGAVRPHSLTLERRNEHIGFSTYLPVGNAHDMPRAVGSLIAVDYDARSGIEYLYLLTRQGLMRSTDGGQTLHALGLPAVQPHAAWAALCVCPDGSLRAASFRTSDTGGSQVWRITNPRARVSPTCTASRPAACAASVTSATRAGSHETTTRLASSANKANSQSRASDKLTSKPSGAFSGCSTVCARQHSASATAKPPLET